MDSKKPGMGRASGMRPEQRCRVPQPGSRRAGIDRDLGHRNDVGGLLALRAGDHVEGHALAFSQGLDSLPNGIGEAKLASKIYKQVFKT